ncbi:MAG: acyl-CoA thioesterase [Candidatus Aminicenantes bacterium]|nr:acyl-CoA thioesterase [Candidatus Aminicenantes bacterium]HHF51948.1 acyl-CoA thioesterase [Candidatus Aminicenantes bacterium]
MKSQNSENPSNTGPSSFKNKPFIETKERVRYSETDKMQVAHNKNYFEWFEIGRTEFCRRKGISYKNIEKKGYYLMVVESFCRYKKPLRYDEEILIRVYLREASRKKFIFDYEVFSITKKHLAAKGYTVHVATDKNAKATTLPDDIFDKMK